MTLAAVPAGPPAAASPNQAPGSGEAERGEAPPMRGVLPALGSAAAGKLVSSEEPPASAAKALKVVPPPNAQESARPPRPLPPADSSRSISCEHAGSAGSA
jgi:hypothetical protein